MPAGIAKPPSTGAATPATAPDPAFPSRSGPAAPAPRTASAPASAVVLATAVGLALRLFRLDHQSLWIDELFTWLSVAIHHPYGLRDWLENLHGPLYGA